MKAYQNVRFRVKMKKEIDTFFSFFFKVSFSLLYIAIDNACSITNKKDCKTSMHTSQVTHVPVFPIETFQSTISLVLGAPKSGKTTFVYSVITRFNKCDRTVVFCRDPKLYGEHFQLYKGVDDQAVKDIIYIQSMCPIKEPMLIVFDDVDIVRELSVYQLLNCARRLNIQLVFSSTNFCDFPSSYVRYLDHLFLTRVEYTQVRDIYTALRTLTPSMEEFEVMVSCCTRLYGVFVIHKADTRLDFFQHFNPPDAFTEFTSRLEESRQYIASLR